MKIGILGFVFLILLFVKVAGIGMGATMSWWLVFAPLWAPLAIVGAIGAFALLTVVLLGGSK